MEKYRTFVPRFGALILDTVLLLPLGIVEELDEKRRIFPKLQMVFSFDYRLFSLAFNLFVVMHGLYGQTVGKMLMKVKVLTFSETPMKFRQAILREAAADSFHHRLVYFSIPFDAERY